PSLACGGTEYLVTWSDDRGGVSDHVFAARVLADGTVLDGTGLLVSADSLDEPAVDFDGTNFVSAWSDTRASVYAARIAPDGTVLDPSGIRVSRVNAYLPRPNLAWNGRTHLLVFGTGTSSD